MKRLKLLTFFFALIALTLNGCGSKAEIADAPYPVIDTGYWSYDVLTLPLWLDNDRLMFASTDSLKPDNSAMHLKVLNTQTGQVASTPFYTAFCVRNGIALFQQKDELTGKTTDYRGTPENYRQEPMRSDDMKFDVDFDCDWVPKATYGQIGFDRPAKAKLRGENFIDVQEPGKPFFHANANAHGVSLSNMSVKYLLWKYSEFLDAYVASGHYDPKNPNASSFAILHSNGELETIPYSKTMLPGNNHIYPVRNGFLVHYADGPITETNHGKRGLYLMQGEQIQRLIIGDFGHVVVSPDGCKAAIAHAYSIQENLTKPSKRTIKFINFCQGDSKS